MLVTVAVNWLGKKYLGMHEFPCVASLFFFLFPPFSFFSFIRAVVFSASDYHVLFMWVSCNLRWLLRKRVRICSFDVLRK